MHKCWLNWMLLYPNYMCHLCVDKRKCLFTVLFSIFIQWTPYVCRLKQILSVFFSLSLSLAFTQYTIEEPSVCWFLSFLIICMFCMSNAARIQSVWIAFDWLQLYVYAYVCSIYLWNLICHIPYFFIWQSCSENHHHHHHMLEMSNVCESILNVCVCRLKIND